MCHLRPPERAQRCQTEAGNICRAISVSQKPPLQVVQLVTPRARPLGAVPALWFADFIEGSVLVLGETLGVVCVSAEKLLSSGTAS